MSYKWVPVAAVANLSLSEPELPNNLKSVMVDSDFAGVKAVVLCRGELPVYAVPLDKWEAYAWAFKGDDEQRIQKLHEEKQ